MSVESVFLSTFVNQRVKMIVHFIVFFNRAHQDEKSEILHVAILKVFAALDITRCTKI